MATECDKCDNFEGWVDYHNYKCKVVQYPFNERFLKSGGCSKFIKKGHCLDVILGLKTPGRQ